MSLADPASGYELVDGKLFEAPDGEWVHRNGYRVVKDALKGHIAKLETRALVAEKQRDELLSALKVWKQATESRCRLLSSRESSDSLLAPDRALIEAVERVEEEG